MAKPMRIDIVFDTICPWCFVGKRRLQLALSQRPGIAFDLHWRPFLLNPDMPENGIPRSLYLERKFGGTSRVSRMLNSLEDAGKKEQIGFQFNSIEVTPNSVESHRLVQLAEQKGLASEVVEALFQAYFCHGRDIGDRNQLIAIGEECGLNKDDCVQLFSSSSGRGEIYLDNAQTHRLSINGVPCFIFDDLYGIAGAQDPDILVRMIDIAADNQIAAPLSSPSRRV
jgi:predicted DsbA family dithiol-disulfide isomerase